MLGESSCQFSKLLWLPPWHLMMIKSHTSLMDEFLLFPFIRPPTAHMRVMRETEHPLVVRSDTSRRLKEDPQSEQNLTLISGWNFQMDITKAIGYLQLPLVLGVKNIDCLRAYRGEWYQGFCRSELPTDSWLSILKYLII